jgi:peptide/nickel transport system ATP-binding protein
MNPILQVKNLHASFDTIDGEVQAVRGISFDLNAGEVIGLVGESGSGKSVTALSIMRLLSESGKITSGEILFRPDDKCVTDLSKISEEEIRKHRGNDIAMIFQEPMSSLNPVLKCGDQVAEALMIHKKFSKAEARQRTLQLFEKVQLTRTEQIYTSYPHQLSGGQQQRIMIAMAISCEPSILIADEPTTSLDATIQAEILSLLKDLQKENKMSMIFISHDLGVIANIADQVAVMYKGKIVESGTTAKIFHQAEHPYTKGLLACRPPLGKRLKKLPTIRDFMQENTDGSVVEISKSVNETLQSLVVDPDDQKKRIASLYSQSPILKVENLKTHFPIRKGLFSSVTDHIRAVDDVSFDVFPGETLGLVGESGCGKTTLGRTIMRLIEPTSGKVFFREKDFLKLSGSEFRQMRKHIQIIFQDPNSSLNPKMSIGDSIMEPMQIHSLHANETERKRKVQRLLEQVGLHPEHFNRYPHEFSGGQRQRICIARALAIEPEFIICDESVSSLDVSVQAQILNLLNDLKREFNLTYIFISHDLSVVKFMSDRMMVMKEGKIEELGDPDQIYYHPQSDYTRRLIQSVPVSA